MQAVEGLRAGRTDAPERQPVRPAVWADVEAALRFMPAPVRALVLVQAHCGARGGELVKLRAGDVDRADPAAWVYRPETHKGTWKGKPRVIYFGARCQEVLAPLLAATRAREELGVDVARALLGHALASVTEVYSHEVDRQLALKAAARFGWPAVPPGRRAGRTAVHICRLAPPESAMRPEYVAERFDLGVTPGTKVGRVNGVVDNVPSSTPAPATGGRTRIG